MKVTIPQRRVATAEFLAALKALAVAKGLDIKHCLHIARVIRKTKEAAEDNATAIDALREQHGGRAEGAMLVFDAATGDKDEKKAKNEAALKAFRDGVKKIGETAVEFELPSLIKLPDGLTADHAEQLLEFFEVEAPKP